MTYASANQRIAYQSEAMTGLVRGGGLGAWRFGRLLKALLGQCLLQCAPSQILAIDFVGNHASSGEKNRRSASAVVANCLCWGVETEQR